MFWCLNHAKVFNLSGKAKWNSSQDYIGFYPEKFALSDTSLYASELESTIPENVNFLYIADVYGVYKDDYKYPERYWTHLDFSKKIVGGFDLQEVEIIQDFVQKGGALVVEFNTFHSPSTSEAKKLLEDILDLKWSGWIGRFFLDLSDEQDVPVWARRHWEAHYEEKWEFRGPGFLFSHQDTRLFVLEDTTDLKNNDLNITISQPKDPLMKHVSKKVPYRYWFDVVYPDSSTDVLALSKLQLTDQGKEKLRKFGVPESFPAVIRSNRSPLRIYFAGDYSDNRLYRGPYFLYGWPSIRRFFCLFSPAQDQNAFYWRFYVPVLKNIFRGSPG